MQECVLVPHIACMFENMSKWGNHTFLFQKSPQVFQGEAHTLCKNQREQQQRWPGYSFRHQEKMWRIGPNQRDSWSSFGKAKTATTIQENFKHSRNYHHLFTQDLSLRPYATPRRPIWQYLVRENGEVRLWEFAGDNEGVIRCVRDVMVSLPWENE